MLGRLKRKNRRGRWIWRVVLCLCLCAMSVLLMATPLWAAKEAVGKRLAFVVGIGTYTILGNEKTLKKAVNDAVKMTSVLESLQYEVIPGYDLTLPQFEEKWLEVLDKISPDDTLLFYFSGHGVQRNGNNYLLPSDIPYLESGREVKLQKKSISVSEMLLDLGRGDQITPQVTLLILDACRNDPFAQGVKGEGLTKGLATTVPPKGTFIMYSADAGGIALERTNREDPEPLSLYTRHLVPLIEDSSLSLQELAVTVRDKVYTQAQIYEHEQFPAYYDQVRGRFCIPGCQVEPSRDQIAARSGEAFTSRVTAKSLEARGGPKMVLISGGTFLMGSPENEDGRQNDEGPQHHVTIQTFELSEMEVTVGAFRRFITSTGYQTEAEREKGCFSFNRGYDFNWKNPGFSQTNQHPVVCVSWHDAQAYVDWLNQKVGLTGTRRYRLPTEAEWEYAAKSGKKQEIWAGTSNKDDLDHYAVYGGNPTNKTALVGSKEPTGWGLYDLSGNVWEWVQDCYYNYEGARSDDLAREPARGGSCGTRVLRGGGWSNIPRDVRSADRSWPLSGLTTDVKTGFRLARTP